ncbi:hypothetical protein [Sphingopyxis microcysteis]|nr:hypothetical protein [Sphingopyxis microcysteis]
MEVSWKARLAMALREQVSVRGRLINSARVSDERSILQINMQILVVREN